MEAACGALTPLGRHLCRRLCSAPTPSAWQPPPAHRLHHQPSHVTTARPAAAAAAAWRSPPESSRIAADASPRSALEGRGPLAGLAGRAAPTNYPTSATLACASSRVLLPCFSDVCRVPFLSACPQLIRWFRWTSDGHHGARLAATLARPESPDGLGSTALFPLVTQGQCPGVTLCPCRPGAVCPPYSPGQHYARVAQDCLDTAPRQHGAVPWQSRRLLGCRGEAASLRLPAR